MLIYTRPKYVPQSRATNGYDYYERDVICNKCGETIGTQKLYSNSKDFWFENREKANYKFCPYCGKSFKEE